MHAGTAVKVKPGMQLVAAGDPACTEGNLIAATVGNRAGQGGLDLVVHVLGRACGHDPQYLVAGISGFIDDGAVAVIAAQTPGGSVIESGVIQLLGCRAIGIQSG